MKGSLTSSASHRSGTLKDSSRSSPHNRYSLLSAKSSREASSGAHSGRSALPEAPSQKLLNASLHISLYSLSSPLESIIKRLLPLQKWGETGAIFPWEGLVLVAQPSLSLSFPTTSKENFPQSKMASIHSSNEAQERGGKGENSMPREGENPPRRRNIFTSRERGKSWPSSPLHLCFSRTILVGVQAFCLVSHEDNLTSGAEESEERIMRQRCCAETKSCKSKHISSTHFSPQSPRPFFRRRRALER